MAQQSVTIAWTPIDPTNSYGYIIHYGYSSGNYVSNIDIGSGINYNNYTLTNLPPETYYFSLSDYNLIANSANSPDVLYTINPSNQTYIGIQLGYGTDLLHFNYQNFQIASFSANQFYTEFLIITNRPFNGIIDINDTNQYTFLGVNLQYGSDLSSMTNIAMGLMTITNQPNLYFQSSLIITNNSIK